MGKGAGSKRSKYRTEEEKMVKEKERRNANNQRERLATYVLTIVTTIHGYQVY